MGRFTATGQPLRAKAANPGSQNSGQITCQTEAVRSLVNNSNPDKAANDVMSESKRHDAVVQTFRLQRADGLVPLV